MVAFVEHQQAETRAQVFHVQVGRVVGGDSQRPQVVLAAADDAHRYAEAGHQTVVPLAHQIESGRHYQGAAAAKIDRHVGHQGLAGSRGQDHYAAATGRIPGSQRLALVGARLAPDHRARGQGLVLPGLVGIGDLQTAQGPDQVCVRRGRRAKAGGALVPGARGWQTGEGRGNPVDFKRA